MSMTNQIKNVVLPPPTTINPDLAAERTNTPFNPINITNFIDGNDPNITIRRRQLESWIIRDPSGIFSNEYNNYLHRTERHKRALAKFTRLVVSVYDMFIIRCDAFSFSYCI